jgi:hypothetical protein
MPFFKSLRRQPRAEAEYGFDLKEKTLALPVGPDLFSRLRERDYQAYQKIITRIFENVCPHALDKTYCSIDESDVGDTCMLCNTRDLANCALVCKDWNGGANKLL